MATRYQLELEMSNCRIFVNKPPKLVRSCLKSKQNIPRASNMNIKPQTNAQMREVAF
ncbi:hypothetical protein ACU8KH_03922 [Lachancea thermotolerans]